MTRVSGTRLIVVGFVVLALGLGLTVAKIGFDLRSVGDANDLCSLVGLVLVIGGARRRRQQWPPPRQKNRFTP